MTYETLLLERRGHVATLTLNRPERMNAFDAAMRAELPRAWTELERDPETWVVVLTGAGDRAFCAGMDLREPAPEPGPDGALPRVHLTPQDCGFMKPVIAAVNGVCAGGGLCFVSDADIVIAADTAYFTDARTSAGQVSIHGTLRLARRIPLESVFRLVLLGKSERIDAARALAIGLVSEVVPAARLAARAQELAETIAKSSPAALFHTKYAIWDSLDHGLGEALERGWDVVTRFAREHPDAREGARAFVEKRAPAWTYSPPPKPAKPTSPPKPGKPT
jgi:enoyl-CoA hydratase/carnithine racemase